MTLRVSKSLPLPGRSERISRTVAGHSPRRGPPSAVPPSRLTLRATARGCALIGPDGEIVFYADGLSGRRQCLEFARERGVLALSR